VYCGAIICAWLGSVVLVLYKIALSRSEKSAESNQKVDDLRLTIEQTGEEWEAALKRFPEGLLVWEREEALWWNRELLSLAGIPAQFPEAQLRTEASPVPRDDS
jgi:hypothetical protein